MIPDEKYSVSKNRCEKISSENLFLELVVLFKLSSKEHHETNSYINILNYHLIS